MDPDPQQGQQLQLPPMKTVVLPAEATLINVDAQPGGASMLRLTCLASGEIFLVTLDEAAAQTIGKALTAPRVLMPTGQVNGNGKGH